MSGVKDETIRAAQRSFEAEGYAIFRGAIDESLLAEMRRHIDARLQSLGGKDIDNLDPMRVTDTNDPFLVRVAADEQLLDIVQAFVGPDIALFSYGYILKSPNDPQPVLWHQDASFPDFAPLSPHCPLTLYVAINSSTRANGCLRVIPGTHKMEVQPLIPRDDIKNFLHASIDDDLVDENRAVDIVLEPGDISIHHANLIHGSEPNPGSTWRLSFVINYFSAHTLIPEPERPIYLLRGQAVPGVNQYAPFPKFQGGVHVAFRGHERWS